MEHVCLCICMKTLLIKKLCQFISNKEWWIFWSIQQGYYAIRELSLICMLHYPFQGAPNHNYTKQVNTWGKVSGLSIVSKILTFHIDHPQLCVSSATKDNITIHLQIIFVYILPQFGHQLCHLIFPWETFIKPSNFR